MNDSTAISTGGPSTPPRKGICWECSGIPSSCFFEPVASETRFELLEISFSGTWDDARKGCALCDSLVAHFGVSDGSGGDGGDSSGSAKETVRCHPSTIEYGGKEFLGFEVICDRRRVSFFESSILRSVPTDLHDMKLAKSWITRCLRSHEEHCGHEKSSGFPLKVIDCNSRELCEILPGTPYICLSYVWRKAFVDDETCVDLSKLLPKTIEDSMWVTLQLGYSYLWVDRYCIDQHNTAEKHHLITNMGAIYKGAALTIIAAVGDSPHSGLPGVNGTPRRQHYSHSIGTSSQKIVGLEHPEEEIRDSVWHTRGWTYQELVLSRRRLIFTWSQMYFQCNTMHRIESISLQATASRTYPSFYDYLMAFQFVNSKSTIHRLYTQIILYCQRKLSFQQDMVKAVTGIINAFELQETTDRVDTTHLFGLPIFYSQMSPAFCLPPGDKYDNTVFTPTSTFAYSLAWTVNRHAGKRNNTAIDILFPSWSWANIKAFQEPDNPLGVLWVGDPMEFSCGQDLRFWLHDESEGSLELNHYIKKFSQEDGRSLAPMISIRSWMISYNAGISEHGYQYGIPVSKEQDRIWLDYPDTPLGDNLVAIYLGSVESDMNTNDEDLRRPLLLVVEMVDDSTWRRVGLRIHHSSKAVWQGEDTLSWLNRVRPDDGWEMRTLCLL